MLRLALAIAGLALASAQCPKLTKVDEGRCPPLTDINKCHEGLGAGKCQSVNGKCAKYCEGGDQGCGNDIDNCFDSSNPQAPTRQADIYWMADCDPSECDGGGGGGTTKKSGDKNKCNHKENIIIAAGDSLTFGNHGSSQIKGIDGNYPAHLQAMFDETNIEVEVINAGESGATAQPFGYNPYACVWGGLEEEHTKTCSKKGGFDKFKANIKKASVVVVMLGTNDAKTKYEATPPHNRNTGTEGMWDSDGERYYKYYVDLLEKMQDMAGGDDGCTKFFVGLSPPEMCDAPFQKNPVPRGEDPGNAQGCIGEDIFGDWGPFLDKDPDGWKRINLYLPKQQMAVANELELDTIDFREAAGDEYNREGEFVAIAADTTETRSDSIHMREQGYRNMAEAAFGEIEPYILGEMEDGSTIFVAREPSYDDSVAVTVPTLVAVVFMAAFALGALATFVAPTRARDAAAQPLLAKDEALI